MLLPDDQLLIDRDRRLPGLRVLLDADALLDALQRRVPDVRIDAARLLYVRYKPRTSCLASYQLDTSLGRVDAHAIAYPAGEDAKLHKGIAEAQPTSLVPGAMVLGGSAPVAVHVFPNDLRLDALRELSSERSRGALLHKLLPAHSELWDAAITRLAYKPHRRFVGLLSLPDGAPRAVAKFYTRGGYEAASRNAKAIESRQLLRVPRRMGRSSRNAIAVYRWIDGSPLGTVDQMSSAMLHRFGAAVREIHAQDAPQLPLIDRAAEARRLVAIASAVADVLPHLAQRARRAVQQLLDAFIEPTVITTIHGDLHAKQVLLSRRTCAVLDLDEAARSSPLADLANFIAHLHRNAIQIGALADHVSSAGEAMLAGYGFDGSSRSRQELAWHTAASLLRLTPHPFRVREVDWVSRTEAMLARVERILADAHVAPSPQASANTVRADAAALDPFGVTGDELLGPLARDAMDLSCVWPISPAAPVVRVLRIVRYKPRRRCIIEYELGDGSIAIGKVRAKGADRAAFRLLRELRLRGFDEHAVDGIIVPEPLGVVEGCGMWVQRKVRGTPADRLLLAGGGSQLAGRIAQAIVKLHRAGVPARKRHTIDDELFLLRERLGEVAENYPEWQAAIRDLLDACTCLGRSLPRVPACGIHRDFYADHVIVTDASQLCLIDLDLYCAGDPALDAGNFLAHLTEQSLRLRHDPDALTEVESGLEERFVALVGEASRPAVRVYRLLALARHIAISRRLPERRHLTRQLITLCQRELSRLESRILTTG